MDECTIRSNKLICNLNDIGIDLCDFHDISIDGLLTSQSPEVVTLIEWIIDNINKNNALTAEEEEELRIIKESGFVSTEDLEVEATQVLEQFSHLENSLKSNIDIIDTEIEELRSLSDDIKDAEKNISHQLLASRPKEKLIEEGNEKARESCLALISSTEQEMISTMKLCDWESDPSLFSLDSYFIEMQDFFKDLNCLTFKDNLKCTPTDVPSHFFEKLCEIEKYKAISRSKLSCIENKQFGSQLCKNQISISELHDEITKLAKEISSLEISKYQISLSTAEIGIVEEQIKQLQHRLNTLSTLHKNTRGISYMLQHCARQTENIKIKFIDLNQNLDSEINILARQEENKHRLKKQMEILRKKKVEKNLILFEFKKLLNCPEDCDYLALVQAAKHLKQEYWEEVVSRTDHLSKSQNVLSNSMTSIIQALINYFQCGPTRHLEILPTGYLKFHLIFSKALAEGSEKIQSLKKQFFQVKDQIRKLGPERKELVWVLFLTDPQKLKSIAEKNERF